MKLLPFNSNFSHLYFNFISCYETKNSRRSGADWIRFTCYCLYAFAVPILLVAAVSFLPLGNIKLLMNSDKCFVDDSQNWSHLYGLTIFLLLLNAFFNIATALKVKRISNEAMNLDRTGGEIYGSIDLNSARFDALFQQLDSQII